MQKATAKVWSMEVQCMQPYPYKENFCNLDPDHSRHGKGIGQPKTTNLQQIGIGCRHPQQQDQGYPCQSIMALLHYASRILACYLVACTENSCFYTWVRALLLKSKNTTLQNIFDGIYLVFPTLGSLA